MPPRKTAELDAVIDELNAVGIPYTVKLGKHYKIRFKVGDRERTIVVPCSGSDVRGARNARALVRRILRGVA